jgi:hypothetical protein
MKHPKPTGRARWEATEAAERLARIKVEGGSLFKKAEGSNPLDAT